MGSRPSEFTFSQPGPLRLFSTAELLNLPQPTWLVDQVLPVGAVTALYGPPESGKSFLAIDLAMCVASGLDWHGHAVQPGFVLYVAAEGGAGISKRVRAWLRYHEREADDSGMGWLIESLSVAKGSEDLRTLTERIAETERIPRLIVIDTLARCFEGNENQQEDMNKFVAALDGWRQAYGSTILAVHHTNVSGDRERGNTAFRAGMDTMIAIDGVETDDSGTTVGFGIKCTKQKDTEHFEPMSFQLRLVEDAMSCVVVSDARAERKDEKVKEMLSLLQNGPMTFDALLNGTKNLPKTTFYRYLVELRKHGVITKENGKWQLL